VAYLKSLIRESSHNRSDAMKHDRANYLRETKQCQLSHDQGPKVHFLMLIWIAIINNGRMTRGSLGHRVR